MKKIFKYDIFISYKHEELDKAVAARLQKKLEQYKIPREIKLKTGKKKIERVFRDEEELSISSDLGKEIEGQLKESEYLLLVCSKKTKDSPWVLREIETFLKYQDIDHVLPVLIEGEPEEVFPEIILQYGEPLAVDLRDTRTKKILKNADKELPRILAPVLHCSYDELKQRHKMYRMYRLLGIVGIGMGVAIIFAAYAIFQSQKLEKQYQETRKNQARYLCNVSANLLESGDRIGALQTAMGVLPENQNDNKPVVLEQMNALNNALYSYKHDNLLCFRANRMEELKENITGEVKVSKKGAYYATVDQNRDAYFFDGETGKLLWKTGSEKLTGEKEGIYACDLVDDKRAILVTKTKTVIVDIKNKRVLFQKLYKSEIEITDVFVVKDKAILWNEGEVIVVQLRTKKKNNPIKISDDNIEQVIADESGKQLFIAVGGELERKGDSLVYSEKNKRNKSGIYKYLLKEKRLEKISNRATEKLCLINNHYIAGVQYTNYKYDNVFNSEITYCLTVYDIKSHKQIWCQKGLKENDPNAQAGCQTFNVKVDEKKDKKVLLFYFKKNVYCLDTDTYKLISKKEYNSQIIGIGQYDDQRLLIGLEDGNIYRYIGYDKKQAVDYSNWMTAETNAGEIKNSFAVSSFLYNNAKGTAVEYGENKIVFLRILQDNKVKILDEYKRRSTVLYFKVKEKRKNVIYRCLNYENPTTGEEIETVIYKSGTKTPIYTINLGKNEEINDIMIGNRNGKLTLCYIIRKNLGLDNKSKLYIIDLQTKKQINHYTLLSEINTISSKGVTYTSDLSYIWMIGDQQGWSMNLTEDTLHLKEEKKWKSKDSIRVVNRTKDDRYLIFTFETYKNHTGQYYLKIWDRKNKDWRKINGKEKILNIESEDDFAIGRTTNVIAVAKNNGAIEIINIDNSTIEKTLNLYKSNEQQGMSSKEMKFFNDDKYLLRLHGNEGLGVIDIKKGELLTKVQDDFSAAQIIVDDDKQFFAVKSDLIGRNRNKVDKLTAYIYMLDSENKTVIKYADVDYGWVSFEGKEVIGGKKGGYNITYYTKLYDFLYLKKEAEKLIKDEKLTQEQKRKYFM